MDRRIPGLSIHEGTKNKQRKPADGWDRGPDEGRTVDEVIDLVTISGRAFSPWYRNGYRKKSNFEAAGYLALDLDRGGWTLDRIQADPFLSRYGLFAYTTPSHSPENPKARVFFQVDLVQDLATWEDYQRRLAAQYPDADQAVKDGARLFFGNDQADVIDLAGEILDPATLTKAPELPRDAPGPADTPGRLLVDGDGRFAAAMRFLGGLVNLKGLTRTQAVAALNAWQGVTFHPDHLYGPERIQELVNRAFDSFEKHPLKEKPAPIIKDLVDILALGEPPPISFLVDRLIADQGVYMFAGGIGVGKSVLSLDLAIALAQDRPKWLGLDLTPGVRVIYVDAENTETSIRRRTWGLKATQGVAAERFFYVNAIEFRGVFQGILDALTPLLAPGKTLIFLDPLYRLHEGDEKEQRDATRFAKPLAVYAAGYDVSFLINHHNRKGGASELSDLDHVNGSNVWTRILDGGLSIRKSYSDEGLILATATKARDWRKPWGELSATFTISEGPDRRATLTPGDLVDEGDHILKAGGKTRGNEMNPDKVRELVQEHLATFKVFAISTKELSQRIKGALPFNVDRRTVTRYIEAAAHLGKVKHLGRGMYGI